MGYIAIIAHKPMFWDISHTFYRKFSYNVFAINRKEGDPVTIELCREKKIAVNALANEAGVPPSTVYSMLNQKSKNPGVVSIKKICDGLGITVRQFFDCPLFDETEQEIR